MIRGIGVAEGIIIGKALLKKNKKIVISRKDVVNIEGEVERLTNAVYKYTEQLEKTYKKTLNVLGEDEALIHKNHLNILRDSVVIGGVKKQIRDKSVNAEYILNEVKGKYEAIYNRMDDDFLRKKAEYIKNITEGIIKQLLDDGHETFKTIEEPCILVADKLDATDTMDLDKTFVVGVILEESNKMTHGAVIAKNWKIPCVIGLKKIMHSIKDGDLLIVDGKKGELIVNPDPETLSHFKEKLGKEEELDKIYHMYTNEKTITKDGYELDINGIVSKTEEVRNAIVNGVDHVGLYRTEGLFVGKAKAPTEEEQYRVYSEAVDSAKGKEICFRTFDCNGKSDLPYIHLPDENNPALGFFSTRIALANREILLVQIKAILRASNKGDVKFVIPMIASVDELLDIRLLIEDAMLMLEEESKTFNKKTKYGVILETPSVAIITNFFAQEIDFLYVDIDDMLQYVTGTDPTNEMIFELYDEFHPGFLRILRSMIRSAHREGTSICFSGSLCNNELLIPVFIAMGVDRLNIMYKNTAKIRWEINSTNKQKWEEFLEVILKMSSGKEIKQYIEKKYGEEYLWNTD